MTKYIYVIHTYMALEDDPKTPLGSGNKASQFYDTKSRRVFEITFFYILLAIFFLFSGP